MILGSILDKVMVALSLRRGVGIAEGEVGKMSWAERMAWPRNYRVVGTIGFPHGVRNYRVVGKWLPWSAQATITKYPRLNGLNNGNLFSHSSRSRCPQGHCLVRAHSITCRWPPLLQVLTWHFLCFSISSLPPLTRMLILLMRALLLWPNLALVTSQGLHSQIL